MFTRCALPILCAALAAPAAQAQVLQVFPGTPSRLQEVVDAAPAGAVLLVFPGDYRGLSIDKPLRIVATPHPWKRVRVLPRLDAAGVAVLTGPLEARDLEAGEALLLAGLDFVDDHAAAQAADERAVARLEDNAGRLHLVDCRFVQSAFVQGGRAAVELSDCAAVSFEGCAFAAAAGEPAAAAEAAHEALRIQRALVSLQDCLLEAAQPAAAGQAPAPAPFARDARLELTRSALHGGGAAPALRLIGGQARLMGSPGTALRGGPAALLDGLLLPAGAAIEADGGAALRIHADVLLAPGAAAGDEEPSEALQLAPDVAFEAIAIRAPAVDFVDSTVVAGGTVQFELQGEPGALLLAAIAFEAELPIELPGLVGQLWLPALSTAFFPVAQAGAAPLQVFGILPASAPIGRQLTAQALQFGPGLELELSAPSLLIVLP